MKPMLIVAAILGGATGVATNALLGSGLVGPAAPGQHLLGPRADLPRQLRGRHPVRAAVRGGVLRVSAVILRASRRRDLELGESGDLEAAIAQTEANKGKGSSVLGTLTQRDGGAPTTLADGTTPVRPRRPRRWPRRWRTARSGRSCSPATPAWGPAPWAPACCAASSRRPATDVDGRQPRGRQPARRRRPRDQPARADRPGPIRAPHSRHMSVDNFMNSPGLRPGGRRGAGPAGRRRGAAR